MKKKITLMMMVMCFLMSIPLKMMAVTVTIHFVDEDGWKDYAAYVYDKSKTVGSVWVTDEWPGQKAAATDIEEVNYKGKKVKVVTWNIDLKECAAGNAYVLFNNNKYNNIEMKCPSSVGWEVKDGQYYYKDGTTSTTPPSEGSGSGSGTTYPTISVKSQYKQEGWGPNNNFNFTTTNGEIYTCELKDVPANETVYFRIVKNDKEWGPNSGSNLELTSEYQTIYQVDNSSVSLQIGPSTVQSTYTITYDSENNQIKCTSTSGSGTGGSTPDEWNTVTTNRLTEKPRVYTQGFYLAGNFFTFDEKDEINYDDAVFKFQQQKDQSISAVAETAYDVYMVEIPASLTAKAQVMYVDANGKKTGIFGPGAAYKTIDKDTPATGQSTAWSVITANESTNLFDNAKNYWNFSTRNVSSSEYSDGLYEVYIAVDKNTHEPKMWRIKHQEKKRVAYFISDTPDATAMPLYDTYKENDEQFANKFFATVNLAANRSYYVISNYIYNNTKVDDAKDYGTIKDFWLNRIPSPTTNKLFLQGNGELDFTGNDPDNLIFPNGAPLKVTDKKYWGTQIVEYNPSRGNSNKSVFGFCGDLILKNQRAALTSVSLVGDAIPGTLNADGTWNYQSNVADMTYDETEQCYKATVVTTVADDGNSKFRFVGNRNSQITWYENTDGTVPAEMAKHPHDSDDPQVFGHTADANDPNQVNYTQDGVNPGKDWNIIWNRPAGRWTVRLYFYTYSDGNNPKTDYYYTITESRDMELHDVEDVVYGSSDNKQIITNLEGYKFMRTWSAQKAWKISDKVDIFVVSSITDDASGVKMTLKKINGDETGADNVIPANTGVILATKSDASEIPGAQFKSRQNFTSYNNLVIPMEQYKDVVEYPKEKNLLEPIPVSRVIPSSDKDNYNYFFGYYNAQIATGDKINYGANDYLLGFWISKGSKPYSSNSSYLPIPKETAAKMNYLGTSYNDFLSGATGGSAKKIPALLFDFANVGSGTTGINEVVNQSTKLNDGKYYTLSGQEVEKPTAGGIYIHNGRKFVVK